MSQPFNTVKVEFKRVAGVPVNLATSFNSGDFMKWDSVNKVVTPIVAGDAASATAAAAFVGVSNDTNPIPSLGQNLPVSRIVCVTAGLCAYAVDDNATYNAGDAVTFGADPQTIRHTANSGSAIIGYVAPENDFTVTAGVSQGIVATPGTVILIYIRPQFTALTGA